MQGKTEPPKTGTVTADDVAELAGVSRWTVNRAFKKDASISPKSRQKVMDAAEELGYVPDLLASSLASDRSNLVAVLIDDFANPHKLVMMERLTRILRKNGWDTLLVNTISEQDASAALLNASQRRVDAAVLIGTKFNHTELETALGARRVKKLILFARNTAYQNTISICCDDRDAMTLIYEYVVRRGYRKPLFLAGPQSPSAHVLRKDTFLKLWSDAWGETPPWISVPAYDPHLGFIEIRDHLKKLKPAERPDIIVCENDALAMGTIDAVRYELGLRVPEDIAVTGFDDVPQAAGPHYQLTSFRQPLTDMANALVEVLKGTEALGDLTRFDGHLMIRNSA
jgi:DNA-binding LacI/PurR family transcriptional regulator